MIVRTNHKPGGSAIHSVQMVAINKLIIMGNSRCLEFLDKYMQERG